MDGYWIVAVAEQPYTNFSADKCHMVSDQVPNSNLLLLYCGFEASHDTENYLSIGAS